MGYLGFLVKAVREGIIYPPYIRGYSWQGSVAYWLWKAKII